MTPLLLLLPLYDASSSFPLWCLFFFLSMTPLLFPLYDASSYFPLWRLFFFNIHRASSSSSLWCLFLFFASSSWFLISTCFYPVVIDWVFFQRLSISVLIICAITTLTTQAFHIGFLFCSFLNCASRFCQYIGAIFINNISSSVTHLPFAENVVVILYFLFHSVSCRVVYYSVFLCELFFYLITCNFLT